MQPEKVFRRYDIRGKYPEEIDEEFAERLGKALGTFITGKYDEKVAVTKDNKESSEKLKLSLIKGLRSTGCEIIDGGTGPTDYTAWIGKKEEAVSVQVTSSHMPLDFNGFKLMYPEGNGFVNEDLYNIQDIFRSEEFEKNTEGDVRNREKEIEKYKQDLIEFATGKTDAKSRKIVVDSLGGTAEILTDILKRIGHEVADLNDKEGIYKDPPNPKPENLKRLKKKVEETDAYVGFANDLDADRITVYFNGRFIDGNQLFSILAEKADPPFIASVDTSKMLEELGEVKYTKVGDPFVMDKALEEDAELAGEPNGHYSFTSFVPYNSGLLVAAIISNMDLRKRIGELPDYHSERTSIEVDDKKEVMKKVIDNIRDKYRVLSEIDGIKYSTANSTVLIRTSGSSPKIRVTGHSRTQEELLKDINQAEKIIRKT